MNLVSFPSSLFTAAFIKTPLSLPACYANCYLGVPTGTRFPGDRGALFGLLPLAVNLVGGSRQPAEVGFCHHRVRVYCPAQLGAWALDLLYVHSTVYGYPRTNGRGQVSPVPVPTCIYKGRGVSATEYIIRIWTAVHLLSIFSYCTTVCKKTYAILN